MDTSSGWDRGKFWIGLAAGSVIGWMLWAWPGWRVALKGQDWWDIATAIGTVGSVIAALVIALSSHHKEKHQRWADGALATFGEKSRIDRMRYDIIQLLGRHHDLDADGIVQAGTRLEEYVRALEAMLHPRYAAFDRQFVRSVIDARAGVDEVSDTLQIGFDWGPRETDLLRAAVQALDTATRSCDRALRAMEKMWA